MPEPPELAYESTTPDEIIARLDILRERLRLQLMDAGDFNAAIRAFQFRDAEGHLWAPGATTSLWYRWDGNNWVGGNPPAALLIPQGPVMFTDDPETSRQRVAKPTGPTAPTVHQTFCPNCGTANTAKKFCTACGTRLEGA